MRLQLQEGCSEFPMLVDTWPLPVQHAQLCMSQNAGRMLHSTHSAVLTASVLVPYMCLSPHLEPAACICARSRQPAAVPAAGDAAAAAR
jgi:hypothetical protein